MFYLLHLIFPAKVKLRQALQTQIIKKLESLENPTNIAGMAHFGIVAKKAFGVNAPTLRNLAKEIKNQINDRHELALELWETGIHEARIIAYLIDEPKKVTNLQMESWAADFDNWAICDGTCGHLCVYRANRLSFITRCQP